MGAYTISKAHRFNGISLPTLYTRETDGALKQIHEDSFDAFARTMGMANNAIA